MPISLNSFIKRSAEFCEKSEIKRIPSHTRGIYALYNKKGGRYEVAYVGMAGGPRAGIKSRIYAHASKKQGEWSHFSVFEVHDNLNAQQVRDLEGLVRHIFRRHPKAMPLCKAKGYKYLSKVKRPLTKWK
jgi:hypothetical protein